MKPLLLQLTTKLSKRFFLVAICALFLNGMALAQNPIVTENALQGNPATEWDIPKLAGDPTIQGFATDLSVNKGQTVYFKIKTDAAAYTINIYRIGYYGGNGARKMGTGTITASLPQIQPAPITDASTGLVDCGNWAISAQWQVPSTAVSGVYLARLTRSDNGGASHIIFVVRDDASTSDLYFKTSDPTWQAYNDYGGGDLYGGTTSYPSGRAVKVSYNRPLITRGGGYGTDPLANGFFNSEYPMIRWLEQNGYNVSYFTSVDAARYSSLMKNHKVCMSVGHDEYWSPEQRSAFEAARDAGVHLAFFSGNEMYWKTRWEPDASGTAYKTLVCYKEGESGEIACNGKCDPLPNVWTGLWRTGCDYPSADGCKPENPVSGQISWYASNPGVPMAVPSTYKDFRFWRNTGIASGQTNTTTNGVLGFEIDWEQNDYKSSYPAGRVTMSETTVAPGITHKLSLYRHANGALVFGAGTIQWAWGLTSVHDGVTSSVADPNMQQATVNVFADMGVQPATLQSGVSAAATVTDRQAPVTAFNTANNATAVVAIPFIITGSATEDAGVVAGVEVSTDGGVNWQPASGVTNTKNTNWAYTWVPTTVGTYTILSRAFDDMGNIKLRGDSITIKVNSLVGTVCPCNIFSASAIPAQLSTQYSGGWPDTNPIEVGVKFSATSNGYITGIRFYKGTNNTGIHIGSLWSSAGVNLASATFTSETASGWQQVTFAQPVAITAGTTYIASYHSNTGYYVSDGSSFVLRQSGPYVYALANGEDGANGVYTYATNSAFPNQAAANNNYWVDVVFNTEAPTDNTPPTVISASPASGANGVDVATGITINFNEALNSSTVNSSTVTIKGADNASVPASINYNSTNQSINIVPAQPLSYSTTYTVTVAGGVADPRIKDVAGNALAANYSFSFTTAAAPTCPCNIFSTSAIPAQLNTQNSGGWPDTNPIEVGVKFSATINGYITGIRFFKGTNNTGIHIGSLWSSTGVNLATATFTSETASGWQQVMFAQPVAITAGTTYIASYHTNTGYYVSDASSFITRQNGAYVYALANGEDGANSVYSYTANSAFPSQAAANINYWVDVVFDTSTAPDTLPPTVTAASPANQSSNVAINTPVTINFNEALDASTVNSTTLLLKTASNTVVPANVVYNSATNSATITPIQPLNYATAYNVTVVGGVADLRIKDVAGNALAANYSFSFTTGAAPTCPCNIFSTSAIPAQLNTQNSGGWPDTNPIEVGVKFSATTNGYITGIRFYKGANNTGVHIGNLWSSAGVNLASATFASETASGWQQVTFAQPVAITAGTTYIASYHSNAGYYVSDNSSFISRLSGPYVYALANGEDGANGVYTYAANSAFPDQAAANINYWVDVVFNTVLPDVIPPTVTTTSPTPGAVGVDVAAGITINFSEALDASTINSSTIILKTAANTVVPASVTYNSATNSIVIKPTQALSYSANYTVTVAGGTTDPRIKDVAGNALAANYSFSFTTAAAPDITPPIIISTSPTNQSSNVAINTPVTINFNEALDVSTVNSSTFVLKNASNIVVAASVTYNSVTNTATITPTQPLNYSTAYTVTVAGGAADPRIKDVAGNALAVNYSFGFTTVAPPDNTAPTVTSTSPASGANSVNVATAITINFSEALDPSTVNSTTLILKNAANTVIPATVTYNSVINFAIITPIQSLSYATTYTVTVVGGASNPRIKDVAGNALAVNYNFSFTTGTPPDTTPPTVSSTSPASGASGVDVATSIIINFSEALDPTTVNSSTLILKTASNTVVTGTITYNSATYTATITPTQSLSAATAYTVTVAGGTANPRIKDIAGNGLAANYTFSFTTAAASVCPCTIWKPTDAPSQIGTQYSGGWPNTNAMELGVKFSTTTNGYITGIRFYKGSNNTGVHIGNLWSSSGVNLARATFTSETASGWQQVTFAKPIAVTAGTTYIASYHTNTGYYVSDGFSFIFRQGGPYVYALASWEDGANGVYSYATNTAFPNQSSAYTNYWVDVVFATAAPVDNTPPTVTSTSPVNQSNNVAINTPVTVNFSEALDATTVSSSTLILKTSTNTVVAANVTYNSATNAASITPTQPLSYSTSYTVTVAGGTSNPRIKDVAGNALAANYNFSFTTSAPVCPCTIWKPTDAPSQIGGQYSGGWPNTNAMELGVKFSSTTNGYITGIRFYKASNNKGTHIGNLWTSTGVNLARATFTSETASGWQQVTFAKPVAIKAGTTYVASYHTNTGYYVSDGSSFVSRQSGPYVYALASWESGGNGVYSYATNTAFPNQSSAYTNFWVDVVFTTTANDKIKSSTGSRQSDAVETTIGLTEINDVENARMTVSPNPTNGRTTVTFIASKTAKYSLEVADAYGRIILKKNGVSKQGTNYADLDLSGKATGVYFITLLYDDGEHKTTKVIKAN